MNKQTPHATVLVDRLSSFRLAKAASMKQEAYNAFKIKKRSTIANIAEEITPFRRGKLLSFELFSQAPS